MRKPCVPGASLFFARAGDEANSLQRFPMIQKVSTDKVTMTTIHSRCYFSITIHGHDSVNVTCISASGLLWWS